MTLFKSENGKINYFRVNVYPTLFGDFLILKECGLTHLKNPSKIVKEYVSSNKEALMQLLDVALDKKKSGYSK